MEMLETKRTVYRSVAIFLSLLWAISVQSQPIEECDQGVGGGIWAQTYEGSTCTTTYSCSIPFRSGGEYIYIHHVGGTADLPEDVLITGRDSVKVSWTDGIWAEAEETMDTYQSISDGIPEGDEFKSCFCSADRDGPGPNDHDSPVRILDMDGWTVGDTVATEADGFMSFLLEFKQPAARDLTIKYYTEDGTAIAGLDYTSSSGSVTVKAGDTSTYIRVPLISDQIADSPESFSLLTHSDQFAGIPKQTAIGTIIGDPHIVLYPASLLMDEGSHRTYTVALGKQPSGDVTVTITEDLSMDLTLNIYSLTFTPNNWDQQQTVTVHAEHDKDIDDNLAILVHAASGGEYDLITKDLPVIVTDDDVPAFVLIPTSLEIPEGSVGSYTVNLATKPSTTITVHNFDVDDLGVVMTPDRLEFTTTNWDTPQEVTVTTFVDSDAANDSTIIHNTSFDAEYDLVYADLPVLVKDDGIADLVISPIRLSLEEGAPSKIFEVRLTKLPHSTVSVSIRLNDAIRGKISVDPKTLVFTTANWDEDQVVTVIGLDDDDGVDESGLIQLFPRGGS